MDCLFTRSARARHLRLRVLPTGVVRVTMPARTAQATAERFVRSHAQWITAQQTQLAARSAANPDLHAVEREHFLQHRTAATALLEMRTAHWANQLSLRPARVTIKKLSSRWGSCSARGNISLSYKLLFVSEELRDYVIVHELCHLRELNHSARFWALVAAALPDFQDRRKTLKQL